MGNVEQGIHLTPGHLIRMVDPMLKLGHSSIGGEVTPGQDLLTKGGVTGCLIIQEGMVGYLSILVRWGVMVQAQSLIGPAFPVDHMLEGAQECLDVIFPSELVQEAMGIMSGVRERSHNC